MTLENLRKKLIYRSWHRGTREMDMIMGSFADRYVPKFTEEQLNAYEDVLQENDPDLYSWISGQEDRPKDKSCGVLTLLLKHQLR